MKKELNENDLSFCYLREYLQSGAGPLSGKQSLFEFIMNSPDRIVVVNCLDSDWVPELLQKCFESLFKWILNANSNIQIPAVIVLNAEDKLRTTIDQDIPYAIPIFGEDFHIKDWVLSKKYYEILGDVGINELNSTIHSAVKHPANLNKKSSDSLSQIYSYNQHLFHQTISKSWEFTIDLDLSITEQMQKPNLFDLELRDYISYYKLIEKGNFVLLSGGIQEGFINVNRLVYAHSLLKDRIAKQISISLQDTSIDAFVVFSDPAIELAHRIQQHIHSRQMNIEIIAVSNYQSPYQDILPIYSDLKRKRIALISTVTSSGELLTNLSADIRKLNGQIVKIFAIYATSKQAIADLLKLNQSKSGLESHILSLYKLSRVSTKDESYTQMIHSDGVSYFHETSLIPQKPRTISYWDWNKSDLNRSLWNKIEQLEGEKQKVISEHLDDNKLHYFLFFNNKLIIQRFGDEIAKSLVAKIVKKVSLNSYTHANLLVASTQWGAQDLTRKIDEALKEKMSHCVLKKFDVVQKVGAISFEISSDQMKNNLLIIIDDEINTGKTILELLDIIYTRYSETMPAEIVVVVFINRMSDSLEKKIGDKYKNLKIYLIHEHRIYIPSFKDSKTGCPACNELKMLESSKREWENNLKLSFDSNQPLLTLDYIKNRINELKDNSPETQSLLSKTKVYNFRYYPHGTSLHPFVIDFNKFSTIPPEFPQFIKSLTDVEINREPALKSCLVSEIDQRKQTDLCFSIMSAIAKFKIIDARNELQLIQKTVEIVPGLKDEEKNEMSYLTKLMDKRINKFSENVFNYLKEKSTREIDRIKISKSILQILQEPVSLVLNNQLKIIIEQLKKLAQKDIPILLIGETGTGKTILAQHYKNFTGLDKFIKVNCGAIHENLIESELFGHEKGAFTDAKSTRVGLLKVADGGILFLDEIDSLHQNHQAKLLTALEKHVFRPVGSNNEVFSHFRLICASGKDLLVGDKFRQDLYYRIGSFQIHILPLREWEESKVKELFESFIMRYEFLFGIKVIQIEPSVIQFIQKYNWPGNIRQMDNVAQRAVFFSKEGVIRISDIYKDPLIDQFDLKGLGDLEKMEAKHEDELRQLVVRKLAECDGNVSQVAKIVKCESSKVYKWLKKWKIDTKEFRKKSE